jgi:hypothetical protein
MTLHDLLTEERPFGPHDQTKIDDTKDAVEILDLYGPLASITRHHYTLIYGRKGSGKSAVISLYQGYRHLAKKVLDDVARIEEVNRSTIYVPVKTWSHFFDMNQNVQGFLVEKMGAKSFDLVDFDLVPVETIEELWLERIWEEVLKKFYDLYRQDEISEQSISNVILCFEDEKLSNLRGTPEYLASAALSNAKKDVLSFLERKNTSVCVLFDSMEKYPIVSSVFGFSMSGFLRALNTFQETHARTRVIFALPEELLPFFHSKSENLLKDFENSYPMRWSPDQLLRMAAHRYRIFLRIKDPEFYKRIKDLDLNLRSSLRQFYSMIFPIFVENEFKMRESAIGYIVRHTQLLPRHFIMHLNKIAISSHAETGGWREFKPYLFHSAIQSTEELLAKEILSPYEYIHRGLGHSLKSAFAGLGPVFTFGDLHRRINRFKDKLQLEHYQIMELLFNVGVIGKLRPETSGLYSNADFYFNRNTPPNFASEEEFCFHPIFSRHFGACDRRDGDERLIYPNGIDSEIRD